MIVLGKKRISSILLITTVLIIWTIILFRIFGYFFNNDDLQIEINNKTQLVPKQKFNKKITSLVNIEYITLKGDPFTFSTIKRPRKKIVTNKKKGSNVQSVQKIDYSIKGIIIGESGSIVIFYDKTNTKTIFLREGENYKYIKINKITDKNILLTEFKETKEIQIGE